MLAGLAALMIFLPASACGDPRRTGAPDGDHVILPSGEAQRIVRVTLSEFARGFRATRVFILRNSSVYPQQHRGDSATDR